MSRTEWGEGTIFQRGDRWQVQVIDRNTGKRRSKTVSTKREAQRALREMNSRVNQGLPAVDQAATFKAWASDWLANRAERTRTANTVAEYEGALRRYVFPVVGAKRLNAITVLDIEHVLDKAFAERDLSQNTLNFIRKAISAVLSDAVKARALSANVAQQASLPTGAKSQRVVKMPSPEQVRALLAAAEGSEVGRALIILATTGARIGELLGSRWSDLDLESGSWTIERTLSRDRASRPIIGGRTKNKKPRTIGLPRVAVHALREQRKFVAEQRLASPDWEDFDLLFPSGHGTPLDSSNFRRRLNRVISNVNKAANEDPSISRWDAGSFHALRHYFAGVGMTHAQAAQVQQLLGHTTLRMTTSTYGHLAETVAFAVPEAVADTL